MGTHRVGTGSLVLLQIVLATLGCASRTPISAPPPCPTFGSAAITDYVRILEWEETGTIGPVNDFHDWMQDQMTYCQGIDAYREAIR